MLRDMIPFRNFFTSRHIRFWKTRDIDWEQAYFTPDHFSKDLLVNVLKDIKIGSIIEFGCASGGNLERIKREFPNVAIGGIDIAPKAIEAAQRLLGDKAEVLEVSSADNVFLSDKSVDMVFSSMCLIYIDPLHINKTIKEMKRVSRKYVLLIEFHDRRWFNRLICRIYNGYNAYNYEKLLKRHGFYDIATKEVRDLELPNWRVTHQADVIFFGKKIKMSAYVILARI
jgi:ubiquinone/menaquinone biosynthesis C-methylase UbiE